MNDEARVTNDESARSVACVSLVIRHSCFVIALLAASASASPARAADDLSDPDLAVEAGRDALRSQRWTPWYDRQADDYKPLNLPPRRKPWSPGWLETLLGGAGGLAAVFKFLMWLLLAVLAVGIAVALLRAWRRRELLPLADTKATDAAGRHVSRVEALPVAIEKPHVDLLAEARRLAAEGDFKLAIVYLFSHQLVEADAAGALRLRKGKTNRQYLRELRRNRPDEPRLPELLERTTTAFERAFFGGYPPTPAEFAACLAGAERLHERLRTPPPQPKEGAA